MFVKWCHHTLNHPCVHLLKHYSICVPAHPQKCCWNVIPCYILFTRMAFPLRYTICLSITTLDLSFCQSFRLYFDYGCHYFSYKILKRYATPFPCISLKNVYRLFCISEVFFVCSSLISKNDLIWCDSSDVSFNFSKVLCFLMRYYVISYICGMFGLHGVSFQLIVIVDAEILF